MLARDRFGFEPIVRHGIPSCRGVKRRTGGEERAVQPILNRPMLKAQPSVNLIPNPMARCHPKGDPVMSQFSKMRHSRHQWKHGPDHMKVDTFGKLYLHTLLAMK